jgi:hypothetical protein
VIFFLNNTLLTVIKSKNYGGKLLVIYMNIAPMITPPTNNTMK